jgi:hypothetical protein
VLWKALSAVVPATFAVVSTHSSFKEGCRQAVVKIIAESLSQHDEKHIVPTSLSGIRVWERKYLIILFYLLLIRLPILTYHYKLINVATAGALTFLIDEMHNQPCGLQMQLRPKVYSTFQSMKLEIIIFRHPSDDQLLRKLHYNYETKKNNRRVILLFMIITISIVYSFSSCPYPTKWGRYNMFSSCCDKDSAFIFTTGRLPNVNPPWKFGWCWRLQMQPGPTA